MNKTSKTHRSLLGEEFIGEMDVLVQDVSRQVKILRDRNRMNPTETLIPF